ncbi:MAG: hypothetical protein JO168_12795 [Solirubrobacterales bacterium]|nr:hypothetical protein [Solirubrobacterales bacterium]MBV9715196.1 hypothetical protein [Solirubrobacterales bacterium]
MEVLSTGTKAKAAAGVKAARTAVKYPALARVGGKVAKPVIKRKARRRGYDVLDTARGAITTIAVYSPLAARELGLVEIEEPKPARTAPGLLIGVVVGAAAVYFLEPSQGKAHRDQVMNMVNQRQGDGS